MCRNADNRSTQNATIKENVVSFLIFYEF